MPTVAGGKKRTRADPSADGEYWLRAQWATQIAGVVKMALVMATVAFGIYCLNDALQAFAGKTTDANVALKLITDIKVSIAWAFGLGGCAYGWRERKLRQRTTERLQGRIKALETQRDPRRTSSGLTATGETNPEDR